MRVSSNGHKSTFSRLLISITIIPQPRVTARANKQMHNFSTAAPFSRAPHEDDKKSRQAQERNSGQTRAAKMRAPRVGLVSYHARVRNTLPSFGLFVPHIRYYVTAREQKKERGKEPPVKQAPGRSPVVRRFDGQARLTSRTAASRKRHFSEEE